MKLFICTLTTLTYLTIATWAVAGPLSMITEIRAVMDSTRQTQQTLIEELGPDPSPELTRRQGELKKTSRMRILQIQLKYAREEGKIGLERRIMTSIEDLQRPAAPGGPRLSGGISPTPVVQAAETPAGGSHP